MGQVYKLLSGIHSEGGKVFRKGDIFESNCDLTKLNSPPFSVKFAKVDDASVKLATGESTNVPAEVAVKEDPESDMEVSDLGYSREELEEMKTKEIESIAEEFGYNISEVTTNPRKRKKELIDLLIG